MTIKHIIRFMPFICFNNFDGDVRWQYFLMWRRQSVWPAWFAFWFTHSTYHSGYYALDYRKTKQESAGPLGNYTPTWILSVLPDKFARFLFEFHAYRFESLDLPLLPADRSDFYVHRALEDDKVTNKTCLSPWIYEHSLLLLYQLYQLFHNKQENRIYTLLKYLFPQILVQW